MAKTEVKAEKSTKKAKKRKNPFRDVEDMEKEIVKFLNVHKTNVSNQAKRISDFFEMCCFNYIVRFYEKSGYQVSVENLIDEKYRYKCSTQGVQYNFSYFRLSISLDGIQHDYELHHNLAVESAHCEGIYTTPDIVIINEEKITENDDHYRGKKRFCYVQNVNLISFCEVKQFNPFPELLFNFMGTLNELKNEVFIGGESELATRHISPSLMISGKGNVHAEKIKESLEGRYNINIFYDLFEKGLATFSNWNVSNIKSI